MSNKEATQNFEAEIKAAKKNLANFFAQRKRRCDHKPNNKGKIISVHDSKINIPNKKNLPETTAVCTKCEAYFESESIDERDIESAFYLVRSMIEQIKLNAHLSEEDWAVIENGYDAIDTLENNIAVYYVDMVEKLSNGNNKKQGNKRTQKGHMGISNNMFNSRGY